MPLGTFNLASRYMGGGGAGAVIPVANRIQSTKGVWSTNGTYNYSTDSGKFGDAGYYITSNYLSLNGFYINWNAGEYRGGSSGKEITIEFWFKVYNQYNFGSAVYPLWSANGIPSTGQDFHLRAQSDNLYLYNNGTYNADLLSLSGGANTNTWHHIAYVSNGASSWKVYLNGTLKATISSGNQVNSWYWGVGSGDSNLRRPYIIDEIRVSKTQRYTANFTAPTSAFTNDSNTLALWHCESSADTDDGTGSNGWLRAPSTASYNSLTSVSGNFGNSLSHSGTTNTPSFSINTPTSLSGNITLEFWMKPPTPVANTLVHSFGDNVRIQWGSDGYRFWTSGASSYKGATSGLNTGSWNYVVLQSDGTNLHRWINGVWKGTFTSYNLNGSNYTFGRNLDTYTFGSDFTGPVYYFDEVRISNIQRYTTGANISVPTAPFVNDSNTIALFHCNSINETDDTTGA